MMKWNTYYVHHCSLHQQNIALDDIEMQTMYTIAVR